MQFLRYFILSILTNAQLENMLTATSKLTRLQKIHLLRHTLLVSGRKNNCYRKTHKSKSMKSQLLGLLLCLQLGTITIYAQNIGINATGATPDTKAILDISSTTSGLLIPRMSTAERNAITTPPTGLQVYNTTTNTLDIYKGSIWDQMDSADTSIKLVRSLSDLPSPVGTEIKLDSTKTYSFSGLVNISPYYINANGAAIRGTNPIRDGVLSMVSGAIIRSTNMHVYIEKLLVVPYSASTKAFDFSDATGLRSCNLLSAINIKDGVATTEGVGQVSGFRAVIILQNYWNTSKGIKVTGTMGRLFAPLPLLAAFHQAVL